MNTYFLVAFFVTGSLAVDYATVTFCGSYDEGIRRVYQASETVCHDGTYYVKCENNYETASLYGCGGNLLGSFPVGECTSGTPVWPGKQVFINCDAFLPSVPNGFAASTLFPVDTDCSSEWYPLSSVRYPPSCRDSAHTNYTTMFCDEFAFQLATCPGNCIGCQFGNNVTPQVCNRMANFPSQVFSCGEDVRIASPQSIPTPVTQSTPNDTPLQSQGHILCLTTTLLGSFLLTL